MTFSVVGAYGTAQTNTSGTDLTIFCSGAIQLQVGDLIVVSIGADNTQTTDGASTLVSSVSEYFNGAFTKAYEYTNGQAAAGAGATTSVWYKRCTVASDALGNGEITITLASAVTARLASAHVFHTTQPIVNLAALIGEAHDTDPSLLTLSGLANREHLFYRATSTERDSYGYTASTNYTGIGQNTTGTDAGADATKMSNAAEYRIFTGTGDSTNPTTGAPQSASVYLAFDDTTYNLALASTSITAQTLTSWTDASTAPSTITAGGESGYVSLNVSGGAAARARSSITTVAGEVYTIAVKNNTSTTCNIFVGTTAGGTNLLGSTVVPANATTSFTFTATTTTSHISLFSNVGTGTSVDFVRAQKIYTAALNAGYTLYCDVQALTLSGIAVGLVTLVELSMAAETLVMAIGLGDMNLIRHYTLALQTKALTIFPIGMYFLGGYTAPPASTRPSSGTLSYTPSAPPQTESLEAVLQWSLQELQNASNVINNLAEGRCAPLAAAPAKPRDGMIRMADGTNWNPGSGRGYYGYNEVTGTWVFFG